MAIPDQLGIPEYQLFVSVKNSGNRTLQISSLSLEMTYPSGKQKSIPAQEYLTFLSGQQSAQQFPMTSVSIPPGANWAESVLFAPPLRPSEQQSMGRDTLRIYQSLTQQLEQGARQPVAADQPDVDAAVAFFNNEFDLEEGQYKVEVLADVDGAKMKMKTFSFVLYEFNIETIRSQTQDYKYGVGVYMPVNQPKQAWIWLNDVH